MCIVFLYTFSYIFKKNAKTLSFLIGIGFVSKEVSKHVLFGQIRLTCFISAAGQCPMESWFVMLDDLVDISCSTCLFFSNICVQEKTYHNRVLFFLIYVILFYFSRF